MKEREEEEESKQPESMFMKLLGNKSKTMRDSSKSRKPVMSKRQAIREGVKLRSIL